MRSARDGRLLSSLQTLNGSYCCLPSVARALHGASAGVGEVRFSAVADLDLICLCYD